MDASTIGNVLIQDGIPCHIRGYALLREAIGFYEPSMSAYDIYSQLAENNGLTVGAAERAVRYAVKHSKNGCPGKGNFAYIAYIWNKINYGLWGV